jgi:hypothetical protein
MSREWLDVYNNCLAFFGSEILGPRLDCIAPDIYFLEARLARRHSACAERGYGAGARGSGRHSGGRGQLLRVGRARGDGAMEAVERTVAEDSRV